jgi:hypothetical protein
MFKLWEADPWDKYCFCMQRAAASPKTAIASSAAPKMIKK